ncbi:hypothetical protein CIHG_07399 [Coccidioides immitis H538.4]|uniref:Uncharacterized protein n=2 Tax=Coccidioides immitis TaxID=5501 RepID=A0A0J8UPZ8_COCIT|nr:hypothetical protein CIRG_00731 [Coccidioides immitis RMSCC 2394]KMU89593.1 hypothetical protein CIHG_07399 [Coccidioides immitis H538.4]
MSLVWVVFRIGSESQDQPSRMRGEARIRDRLLNFQPTSLPNKNMGFEWLCLPFEHISSVLWGYVVINQYLIPELLRSSAFSALDVLLTDYWLCIHALLAFSSAALSSKEAARTQNRSQKTFEQFSINDWEPLTGHAVSVLQLQYSAMRYAPLITMSLFCTYYVKIPSRGHTIKIARH